MTNAEAVRWVDDNKSLIITYAKFYVNYTPYAVADYVQDAYAASVEAAFCCRNNPKLVFSSVFNVVFKRMVAKVTPLPEEGREEMIKNRGKRRGETIIQTESESVTKPGKPYYSGGTSMSLPDNWRDYPELDDVEDVKDKRPVVDIEKVYLEKIRGMLTDKERLAMDYALGTTKEGSLSYSEIGTKMGVSREAAKKRVGRAISRIIDIFPAIQNVDHEDDMADAVNM